MKLADLFKDNTNELHDFFKDLKDLCEKHKVEITGCSCCNSPYVHKIVDEGSQSQ